MVELADVGDEAAPTTVNDRDIEEDPGIPPGLTSESDAGPCDIVDDGDIEEDPGIPPGLTSGSDASP